MEHLDIKTAKQYRRVARILFCIFNYVTPVVLISMKYKLLTKASGLKFTVLGLILAILLIYNFKNKLLAWINSWEYSSLKYILLGFSKIALFAVLYLISLLAERGIGSISFCLGWVFVCSSFSYLLINPYIEKYDYIVKKELRKAEMKEALHEYHK